MADQQHDNKDDCPEVNQHLGSVPFVIGRDGNRDGWYTSYPFPPPRICGMIRQPSAAPPHRSPNSDGVSSLPHFVWTLPRPLRAITRCKPSIREIYPAPAARGTSPARTPPPGVAPIRRSWLGCRRTRQSTTPNGVLQTRCSVVSCITCAGLASRTGAHLQLRSTHPPGPCPTRQSPTFCGRVNPDGSLAHVLLGGCGR